MPHPEPQENTQEAEWWHKPEGMPHVNLPENGYATTIDVSEAMPLFAQVRQLKQTVEALEKRVAALEAHNALSIEELEAELHARYDRHTRHVLHGGIHVV